MREDSLNAYPSIDAVNHPESETFEKKDTKWYVSVVTLSTQDDNKLLEQLKTGLKRTVKCINPDHKSLIPLKLTI